VAIVGRPNVGKSTLTNRLVGEKIAIVSDVPQTTRWTIRGVLTRPTGQIVVLDTPGILKPHHELSRRMMAEATGALLRADLILLVVEATGRSFGPQDRTILEQLPAGGPPVVLVINKIDRVARQALLPLIARVKDLFPFREILLVSALTGDGMDDLPERIIACLPEGPPLFPGDDLTDQTIRSMAAEIVREKLLHHTRQEIPHELCVLIDTFEEKESLTRIEASILVERDSQRRIVIGREGSMLKTVGTEARVEIETLLGRKVFLNLWVKVRPGWREDHGILRAMGLEPGRER
jgi:GTP-binding protein Era